MQATRAAAPAWLTHGGWALLVSIPDCTSLVVTKLKSCRPQFDALEDRLAPATLYALTDSNVWRFDSSAPGVITNSARISGLSAGERVVGIDFRPLTGHCYALAVTDTHGNDTGRVYQLNPLTGVLT